MNKYFSDYLPPALIRDLRRCLRTPWYLIMLGVFLIFAVWVQYDSLSDSPAMNFYMMALAGAVLMWVVIPGRAGSSVSDDGKVKGTNFLMLTPLSSRQLIWGTWISACVQLLIVAGIGALIHWWHVSAADMKGEQLTQSWTSYGMMVAVGVLMCAVFLFTAQLGRLLRILLTLFVLLNGINLVILYLESMLFTGKTPMSMFLEWFRGDVVYVVVGDVVLSILLLMEFARRNYAAPAENCSRSVRLLVLLAVGSVTLVHYYADAALVAGQLEFVTWYALFACMCDSLLPTYSMKAHDKRAWAIVPAYLQVPGVGQSAFFLLLMGAALCWQWYSYAMFNTAWTDVVYLGVSMTYTVLCLLLLTDMSCRRDNVNRPMVCAVFALLLTIISFIVCQTVPEFSLKYVAAAMPFGWTSAAVADKTLMVGISSGCLLVVLLLLMFWRGRR